MKIAIVGYGWLGLPLAKSLRLEDHDLIGTSTTQSKVESLNAEGLKAIFFTGEATEELKLELADSDWIVLTIPPSGNVDYLSVLNEIVTAISATSQVIFTSSIGVYREVNGLVNEQSQLKEDHPVVKAERFLQDELENRLTILRLGGLIGEDRHPVNYLAGRKDLEGGENPVNLIHLEDVINAIKAIIKNNVIGKIFNLVYPDHPTKKEYYSTMAEKMKLQIPQFIEDNAKGKIVDGSLISKRINFEYSMPIIKT